MTLEGIEFKTNCSVGKDVTANELVTDNDAVVLCTGATWPRDLPIPGRCEKYGLICLLFCYFIA